MHSFHQVSGHYRHTAEKIVQNQAKHPKVGLGFTDDEAMMLLCFLLGMLPLHIIFILTRDTEQQTVSWCNGFGVWSQFDFIFSVFNFFIDLVTL